MIFDCFTYFNESVTLDFRLNYLAPYVDYFVIVESGITFSGRTKEFTANEVISRQSSDIRNKCRLIQLNNWPTNTYSSKCNWEREFYQRNAILQGLPDTSHGDFVFITDVDEIPNPFMFSQFFSIASRYTGLNLCMDMFYYEANNWMFENDRPLIWTFPKVVSAPYLYLPQTIRMSFQEYPYLLNCGWHFSYMGGVAAIKTKITSYAHQENNNQNILSSLDSNLDSNKDLFDRNYSFSTYDLSKLPDLMLSNTQYREFFLPTLP